MVLKKLKGNIHALYRRVRQMLSFQRRHLLKPSLPTNPDGKILVHLGCGEIDLPGFINIDAQPFAHIHYVTDNITDLGMFGTQGVDFIYMSHVLEHVSHRNVREVLRELYRVLKTGGILRISVPDFDKLVAFYLEQEKDLEGIQKPLMGSQHTPYEYHYAIFNRRVLTALLLEVGFAAIHDWDPFNCDYHSIEDFASMALMGQDGKRYPLSLNLEAVK